MENRRKGNQRKNRIFWKVFIVNIIMLLLIVIIAYLLLYFLLPTFYRNYKLREFEELTLNVIERIEREQNEAEELLKFSNEYNVDVLLKDKYDNIIFDYYKSDTIVTNVEQEQDMPEIFVQMDEEMSKMAELCMSYKLHK